MSAPSQSPRRAFGLLLSDDMIFTSRITGTARDLGLVVKPARSIEGLHALIRQQTPDCIIVDLAHPELQIAALHAGSAQHLFAHAPSGRLRLAHRYRYPSAGKRGWL